MKKYLAPLGVFLGGQLLLLIVYLFLPSVKASSVQLEADTAALAPTFWGWSWAVKGMALFVVIAYELGVLWATAKAFLGLRN